MRGTRFCVLAVDIPNPLGPIIQGAGSLLSGGASALGSAAVAAVVDWFVNALGSACTTVATGLFSFLGTASSVNLHEGWWAGPRAQQILTSVTQMAGVLMIAFLLLVVIQGTLAGEPAVMVRAAAREVPIAVFGTVALIAITTLLLGLTDAASGMVLADAPEWLGRFLAGFTSAAPAAGGLIAILLLVLFLVGATLVWIELIVRASLIYLLIACAPLALAARVWPAARGAFRRLCEIGLALILSKFVIALALGLGAAALGGGGPQPDGVGAAVATDFGGLLAGATLMLLSAFTPFVLLKLLPIAETAVLAQGISRSPTRAVNTVAQTAFYARSLGLGASRSGAGGAPPRPGPGIDGATAGAPPPRPTTSTGSGPKSGETA